MSVRLIRVRVTHDGRAVEDLIFDTPPTLAKLAATAGPAAFIVSVHWPDGPLEAETAGVPALAE
ncbi:hypothetical protein OEZ60_06390 [Defluviimonas sp. WL0024]|uniref:Uncharacterized protein n=2 Tax=Albidovulum TaxID=205889 RepID=A0ABT3J2N9_9RHOB|nr:MULTISPECIES: hypothetical protein [Defluviimonas]MCU9847631.1 hypothetical protein [Defluviimonas sp. WL0024]MCW3781941.1 hypothetical protein [Defluviimonas salinarum]